MATTPLGIENQEIKGITVKNMIVTVLCTISVVSTALFTYYSQQTQNAITNLRIEVIEKRMILLEQQVQDLKENHK